MLTRSAPWLRRLIVAASVLAVTAATVGTTAAAKPVTFAPRDAGQAWDDGSTSGMATPTGRLIVTFKPGTTPAQKARAVAGKQMTLIDDMGGSVYGAYRTNLSLAALRTDAQKDPSIVSIAPDLRLHRDVDPTAEPGWRYLWGLHNTGQPIRGSSGTSNVDIDGLEAEAITGGDPSVVVAVIDDGVDFSHPDLAARAWTNPGESGPDGLGGDKATNGIDDDGNNYIDDVHGWDFCNNDNTVHDFDHDFHGTHVAGTIAASLDGQGVVGVAPNVSIMALKFLDDDASLNCGDTIMAIKAIAYAKSFGVVLSNNSWGGRGSLADFQPLYDVIASSGLLFVTSAGNEGIDNDTNPSPAYPASFDLPNVIAVAAADKDGGLAAFSNYGRKTVDLAAPGVDILSSLPADPFFQDPGWGWLDGTSMASPHVTGVAALMASQDPTLLQPANLATFKARLLSSGKALPLTAGETVTGRMVDARFALDAVAPTAFAPNSQVLTVGSVLGTTVVSAKIGWRIATDDASGIASYDLEQQVNNGAWTPAVTRTTAHVVARTLTVGATYRFRVRARDRAGNLSPFMIGSPFTPKRFQETTSLATYSGNWSLSTSTSASGGKLKFATRAAASVSFRFNGRGVAVAVPKGPTRGSARIYVDNVYAGVFSEYRTTTASRMLIYARSWTTNGTHTIKLVLVGTAGRPRFDIDAFVVLR